MNRPGTKGHWHHILLVGLSPEDLVKPPTVVGEIDGDPDASRILHESMQRIRRSIAAGRYLTAERIDGTVEQLRRELLGY